MSGTKWCKRPHQSAQFSSVQSFSRVWLFVTPWIAACQASLSITSSRSSLRLTSNESVMPSSHLILCRPLLLLPPIPPSIRVFSNESTLHMRWPKYWSFSFSIIPSREIPGLISFRMDWLDLLHSKGLSRVFSNTYSSPFRGDSSSGKPVLTSTGWENCSGYEEAVFLWIDVCVSFQFHRSRVCNQSSAPTQISKPVSRGWDEVVGCSFWPTHIPPWRNTHTQVSLSRSTSMDFTAKRRERPHHGCSHSTLFLNFSFLINESLTSLPHCTP